MANVFFSINKGANRLSSNVTTGASTTAGDNVELRLTDTIAISKNELRILVGQLLDYIDDVSTFPNA